VPVVKRNQLVYIIACCLYAKYKEFRNRKHFYSRIKELNAAGFVEALEERMPFPVKANQVDDGSGCDQENGNRRQLPAGKTYLKAYEEHLAARDFRL
jgi:hypothetical protein